jgi:hypothetical protein
VRVRFPVLGSLKRKILKKTRGEHELAFRLINLKVALHFVCYLVEVVGRSQS